MNVDRDIGIDLPHSVARGLGLGSAYVGLPVNDLPLQIGFIDRVELNDAKGADSGSRQVHECRAAQAAGADAEHAGVLQTLLSDHSDIGDDQVAAIAPDFVDRQIISRAHYRR